MHNFEPGFLSRFNVNCFVGGLPEDAKWREFVWQIECLFDRNNEVPPTPPESTSKSDMEAALTAAISRLFEPLDSLRTYVQAEGYNRGLRRLYGDLEARSRDACRFLAYVIQHEKVLRYSQARPPKVWRFILKGSNRGGILSERTWLNWKKGRLKQYVDPNSTPKLVRIRLDCPLLTKSNYDDHRAY